VTIALSLTIQLQFDIECLQCLNQRGGGYFGPKYRGRGDLCKSNFNPIWKRHWAVVCKKIVSIASAVSAQCMDVTDRQTDRQRDKEQNCIVNHLLHKSSFYSQFPRCNTLFAILPHTQFAQLKTELRCLELSL